MLQNYNIKLTAYFSIQSNIRIESRDKKIIEFYMVLFVSKAIIL